MNSANFKYATLRTYVYSIGFYENKFKNHVDKTGLLSYPVGELVY